jgi:hypothetical protein
MFRFKANGWRYPQKATVRVVPLTWATKFYTHTETNDCRTTFGCSLYIVTTCGYGAVGSLNCTGLEAPNTGSVRVPMAHSVRLQSHTGRHTIVSSPPPPRTISSFNLKTKIETTMRIFLCLLTEHTSFCSITAVRCIVRDGNFLLYSR